MIAPDSTLAIVGLGYVGLPLAVEFGKCRPTIGFDTDAKRVSELQAGQDRTREVDPEELKQAVNLTYTTNLEMIRQARVYIIAVPTPIDSHRLPKLTNLLEASEAVGRLLKAGDVVIYESTVYPGATEEKCIPVLEQVSGLRANEDFYCGYSPERINPGDKLHRLTSITKVVAGSTPEAADAVEALYSSIIRKGTYKTKSIRIAEAAKIIENTQRDLNIALVNELAIIFNKLGIDTSSVLEAANTKWNFLSFQPGLVGGHCIGVDPYYLTFKAEEIGYHSQVILAGRRINDSMSTYISDQMVKAMIKRRIHIFGSRVIIMGLTFKENCPDIRNTKIVDLIDELEDYGIIVDVHDPWVDENEAATEYGITLTRSPEMRAYDGILLAVAHDVFLALGEQGLRQLGRENAILYDVKSVLAVDESDLRL